jgi:pyruvate formate lyase activating enzyme
METSMAVQGCVFDTQRFCLHDGRGIRTTVFLKGCPLKCQWCHNPESWSPSPERAWRSSWCIGCLACVAACERGALRWDGDAPVVDAAQCMMDGACAAACPTGATDILGRVVEPADVVRELLRDVAVFDESGGGATFSGGEPMAQAAFLEQVLLLCREAGIHTTLDTSGHAPKAEMARIGRLVDAVLFDVKHPDDDAHLLATGVTTRLILENLVLLNALQREHGSPEITVRVPLVAGFNDSREVAEALARLLSALDPVPPVDLLPYQRLGEAKYLRLGRPYPIPAARPPSHSQLQEFRSVLDGAGLRVTIRGDNDVHH